VSERCSFDYALIRVVPRVDRGEFLNVGVILFCPTRAFLDARIEVDEQRLTALWAGLDRETIDSYLEVIPRICRGGAEAGAIGALSQRERFHWLVAPRSTIIQMSPVHPGVHHDLEIALEVLMRQLVRT
jgi:hypothetical protein